MSYTIELTDTSGRGAAAPGVARIGPVESILLPDDGRVMVRPIMAQDARRLRRLVDRLSDRSFYHRFFTGNRRALEGMCPSFVELDYHDRYALAALDGDEIVAVARYNRARQADEAEIGVLVADAWQARGLGRLLLGRLAIVA